jgi:hypothetical protein
MMDGFTRKAEPLTPHWNSTYATVSQPRSWLASRCAEAVQHLVRRADLAEHARERHQRRLVGLAPEVGGAPVLDQDAVIAAVCRLARRRFDTPLGNHADDHEAGDPHVLEQLIDRAGVEGAVGVLGNDQLAWPGLKLGHNLVV